MPAQFFKFDLPSSGSQPRSGGFRIVGGLGMIGFGLIILFVPEILQALLAGICFVIGGTSLLSAWKSMRSKPQQMRQTPDDFYDV